MIEFTNYGAGEFIELLISFFILSMVLTSFLYSFKYFIYATLKR